MSKASRERYRPKLKHQRKREKGDKVKSKIDRLHPPAQPPEDEDDGNQANQ